MFMSLFIGDPQDVVDPHSSFSLTDRNKKTFLTDNISMRSIPIQSRRNIKNDAPFEINQNTESVMVVDQIISEPIGILGASGIDEYRMRITHDTISLHPRMSFVFADDVVIPNEVDVSQIFVNIDTNLFVPLIYQFPDSITVKDTYHYGKHYYGFILEKQALLSDTKMDHIEIYGYDKRLPVSENNLSNYRLIKIYLNTRYATEKERADHDSKEDLLRHDMNVEVSTMSKDTKTQFFRARGMYTKNPKPRFVSLTGPLYTTYVVGDIPLVDAFDTLVEFKEKNNIPVGYEIRYHYISRDDCKSDKVWYNKLIDKMCELGNNRVRAVGLLCDTKVLIKDFRKTKLHHLIRVNEDGTSTSLLSNR